jgi:hypothetical protein
MEFNETVSAGRKRPPLVCSLTEHFPGDVFGDIPRPTFGRIESDDPHRAVELAGQEIINYRIEPGALFVVSRYTRPAMPKSSSTTCTAKSNSGTSLGVREGDRILCNSCSTRLNVSLPGSFQLGSIPLCSNSPSPLTSVRRGLIQQR